MHGLTDRQRECLDVIKFWLAERGYPPTLREIGEAMGIKSTNGINDHLCALERKNMIKREDLRSRAIVLLGPALDEDERDFDPLAPTRGQLVQRMRCRVCCAHTFAAGCPYCPAGILEVA
jgi:SOS-response transcriptional repressor LexA